MDANTSGDGHKPTLTSQATQNTSTNNSTSNKADKSEKQTLNETRHANNKEVFGTGKAGKLTAGVAGSGTGVGTTAAGGDKKVCVHFDDKTKMELDVEVTELLGSVTTHNCPGTRTSARVIQKMKQDQIRPTTPPPSERELKKEEKNVQKTPSQVRANKPTWTNLERNHFFDAVNEFGKDFDALGNYINSKLKRKSATDISYKTKDQVRQHYYQTYHKICKYIKFSEEIKKPAQELYALINYGEMRRKLQFVTDKHFMKLKNLVYQGHITVRCKGKNIRIKTPSCKALRRLNQLDDSLEDIRLPSKIEVIVSPANMESFGRVQTIAQNPRARTTVPLHKKLVNFIKSFQYKWRSSEMKLAAEEVKLFPASQPSAVVAASEPNGPSENTEKSAVAGASYVDAEMCFLPKPGTIIHRPLLSITEYLSSVNICLTAYEERMGVKVRGETLSQERCNNKRQRSDSSSEKRSPDSKKQKPITISSSNSHAHEKCETTVGCPEAVTEETLKDEQLKSESSGDELNDEMNELLSDSDMIVKDEFLPAVAVKNETAITNAATASSSSSYTTVVSSSTTTPSTATPPSTHTPRSKRNNANNAKNPTRPSLTFKPLLNDEVIERIRKGWTVSNAADITIGDLYVVLGQDSRLELEYYWADGLHSPCESSVRVTAGNFAQKQNGMPYNPTECDDPNLLRTLSTSTVGNKLKHLLLIANLSERLRKRQQCSCGHTCERSAIKTRIERDLVAKTFVSAKSFNSSSSSSENNGFFRQPIAPIRRPIYNSDSVKHLSTFTRPKLSRQVIVQRLLLPGGSNRSYDLLDVKNLQNHFSDSNRTSGTNTTHQPQHASPIAEEPTTIFAAAGSFPEDSSSVDKVDGTSRPLNTCSLATTDESSSSNFNCISAASASNNIQHSNLEQKTDDGSFEQQRNELSLSSSLSNSAFDECSNTSIFNGMMSPMNLVRDSTSNSRWLEENLNDFSLTSLLGHLDEINTSRDILDPSSNLSVISESSVDFMHKFQEITALMQSQDKN